MDSYSSVSETLQLTILASSFGFGYVGAIVVERNRYVELLLTLRSRRTPRASVRMLVLSGSISLFALGYIFGNLMAVLCSEGLLGFFRIPVGTQEAASIGIIFVISAIGALFGAGFMIDSIWKNRKRYFPHSDDLYDPPISGPWKGT
ncbi:MAG: hypothetical protein V1885_02220 [Candidatus Brennerbacteria bacterium]